MALMLQRHYTDQFVGFVGKASQIPFHASTTPNYYFYHNSIRISSPNSNDISHGYMFSQNIILSLI